MLELDLAGVYFFCLASSLVALILWALFVDMVLSVSLVHMVLLSLIQVALLVRVLFVDVELTDMVPFIDITFQMSWRVGVVGCWCRMKESSLAVPNLDLFTYIELPRILMCLLSTPLSIRARLSLRSVDSVFRSAIDMRGLMDTLGCSEENNLCLFERTVATSQERTNLAIKGLVLDSEYLPILVQSHIA